MTSTADPIARTTSVPISVDTSRPEVMREAVGAGAVTINDVRALRLRGALDAAVALKVPVCLMHMQGEPATMRIANLGYPVMAGLSRKGMLGAITGRAVTGRRAASVTAAVIAAQQGASILRVHDVAATVDAVAVIRAVDTARATAPKYPQLM